MTRALEEPMSNHSRDKACRRVIVSATGPGGSNQGVRDFFFTLMTSSIFVQCINGSEVGCTVEVSGNIGRRGR